MLRFEPGQKRGLKREANTAKAKFCSQNVLVTLSGERPELNLLNSLHGQPEKGKLLGWLNRKEE
jgi:hypothetical protein